MGQCLYEHTLAGLCFILSSGPYGGVIVRQMILYSTRYSLEGLILSTDSWVWLPTRSLEDFVGVSAAFRCGEVSIFDLVLCITFLGPLWQSHSLSDDSV